MAPALRIAAAALALVVVGAATTAGDQPRPNILFAFADDWGRYASSYAALDPAAGPNTVIRTPHFDRVARSGVLFRNAFVTAPSCTPCRTSLLSGQYFFRTGRAAILQGAEWDGSIASFPLMLRDAGYHMGKLYKVWSPGTPADAPYGGQKYGFETRGPNFNSFSQVATNLIRDGKSVAEAKQILFDKVRGEFDAFLDAKPEVQPFCFWFGPTNVHRRWIQGSGKQLWDLDPDSLQGKLPAFLPDVPVVREDLADYLGEAMAFDAALGLLLEELERRGELKNTLVIVSGDHGAPGFPRGKCNLYDFGTSVALAAMWGGDGERKIAAGRVVDDFVNLMDLAPTFLEAAGLRPPQEMTGRSLMPILLSDRSGQVLPEFDFVVTGRERHVAAAREGGLPYPQRALRTKDYLYIHNFKPDRWPMGDPGPVATAAVPDFKTLANQTFCCFADLDASPTKAFMVEHRGHPLYRRQYAWGFGKRPARELYLLQDDPDQVDNVADLPMHAKTVASLQERLFAELRRAGDPRVLSEDPLFEHSPFTDIPGKKK